MQTVSVGCDQHRDLHDAEQTLALLDDPQWIREEFDAIIAAEWPQDAPSPPRSCAAAPKTPDVPGWRSTTVDARVGMPRAPEAAGTDYWVRERSPPGPCGGRGAEDLFLPRQGVEDGEHCVMGALRRTVQGRHE